MTTALGRAVLLVLALACVRGALGAPSSCSSVSGARTLPLVELYTSEGCDSCPPADRWLRETFAPPQQASSARAAVLAFHVDYWDSLGWPDRFASHAHTERQQMLVRAGGRRTAYTPQLFIQGRDRGLWRDGSVSKALDEIGRAPARAHIELAARADADAVIVDVRARVDAVKPADLELRVALTEGGLSSRVTAGENAGVELAHGHVVRAFVTGPAFDAGGNAAGRVRLVLPRERGRDAAVVAFVEHRATAEILQSLSLPLCGA